MRTDVLFMLLLLALLIGIGTAYAEEVNTIEYVDVGDQAVQMKDDFSIRAVVQRKSAKSAMECSIQFYNQDSSWYTLSLRWMRGARCDLSLEKYVREQYMGAMLAVEFEETKKTGYVSVDDGWDATSDTEMEVVLIVRNNIATLTMTGNVSKISTTLHFDLTQSPWLSKYTEDKPLALTEGQLTHSIRGGTLSFLGVDVDTWNGKKAELPEDLWAKAWQDARYAKTPLGTLAVGDYTAGYYQYEGMSLPYQIHLPKNYEEGKEYPVMVFLHGAGFRGSDNKQVIASPEYVICRRLIQENRECIVVAPQSMEYWTSFPTLHSAARPRRLIPYEGIEESDYLKAVLAMISEMKETNFVDDSRVYISGYSMGAHACWYLLATYPDDYAAAILSCGVGSIEKADVIAKTPIYVFHGDKDDLVDFESGKTLTEAVRNAGGETVFIHAEGYDHGISVPMRMDNNVLDWLFQHTKEQPEK